MTLLALLTVLSVEAEACSPGPAEVLSYVPADGATEVPTDARVVVTMGNGYIGMKGEPVIELSVDGAAVPGRQELWRRTMDLTSETGQVIFTPDAPFPAGAEVEVHLSGVGWAGETEAWSFTVGDEAAAEAPGAPTLDEVTVTHVVNEGSLNSCSAEEWREARFKATPAAGTADANAWLWLYRSEGGVVEDTPFGLMGPLVDDGQLVLDARSFYDIDRPLTAECFAVAQVDAAGRLTFAEGAVCSPNTAAGGGDDDVVWKGGGCATAAPGGLLGVSLAVLATWRRRRPSGCAV